MIIKEIKMCLACRGYGEVSTLESVYGGSDSHIQAPVGTATCDNCKGSGEEPDERIVLERALEALTPREEAKLQIIFSNEREYGGIPITKDNCDDLFEQWLGGLSLEELIGMLYEQ